jgi:hypothetical protein
MFSFLFCHLLKHFIQQEKKTKKESSKSDLGTKFHNL